MAKAAAKSITWTLLRDAKARVAEVYGSPRLAEQLLVEWLAAGRLRWSCKRIDARVPKTHPLATRKEGAEFWGERGFWSERRAGIWTLGLYVNWAESWARNGYTAWAVVVPAADLDAILHTPAIAPQRREARQFNEAVRVLRKLYSPDGVAPVSISTKQLQAQIETKLQDEQRQRGLSPHGVVAPSYRVVRRARKSLGC
jgi:hypothetical protein